MKQCCKKSNHLLLDQLISSDKKQASFQVQKSILNFETEVNFKPSAG